MYESDARLKFVMFFTCFDVDTMLNEYANQHAESNIPTVPISPVSTLRVRDHEHARCDATRRRQAAETQRAERLNF